MRASMHAGAFLLVATLGACHEGDRTMPGASAPVFVERTIAPRRPTADAPPLLVLLHGIGADENDLVPLASELDPRFLVVSLRAPRRYAMGYSWFDLAWRPDGTVVPNVVEARQSLGELLAWIAAAPGRLGTDPTRLYLLGFSQGAMMSLGALRAAPERLAGVVALSGRFADALFDAPPLDADVARVPLFVAHGTADDVLPVDSGRGIRATFEPLVHDFTYREYPVGHGIAAGEIRDVGTWLTVHLDRPSPW